MIRCEEVTKTFCKNGAEVVSLARAHFDLDALDIEVRIEDARKMLRKEKGRFDLVVEDIFVGRGDDAVSYTHLTLPTKA